METRSARKTPPTLTTTFRSKIAHVAFTLATLFILVFTLMPNAFSEPTQERSPTEPHIQEAVIRNNPGGSTRKFKNIRDALIANNTHLRIGGYCASACTLFTAVPNVCVEPGTRLMFHAPFYMPVEGMKAWSDEGTQEMLDQYPPKIKAWLIAHGGLQHDITTLDGPELYKIIPLCDQKEVATG